MAEVIPSNATFDQRRRSSQRCLRTGVAQGSNIRRSVGSTRLCRHDAQVMAKHIRNLAEQASETGANSAIAHSMFHRKIQGFWPPQMAAARTPGTERRPPPVTRDCRLLAFSREAASSRLCSWRRCARVVRSIVLI